MPKKSAKQLLGALILLFILLIVAVVTETWDAPDAALVFIAVCAFLISAFNVIELQNQRRDSQRPLVTPRRGYVIKQRGTPEHREELCIQNIGAGPASNITIRIERRQSEEIDIKLNDSEASVLPLGVGKDSLVFHSKKDGPTVDVHKDEWLVISYDDIFGNRFHTECQWDSRAWHSFKSERVS